MDAAVIAACELGKSFEPHRWALQDVTFTVSAGEVFALVGSAGAGKTTTVNLLMGAAAPTTGTATIAGINPARDARQVRASASFIGPNAAPYPEMTARQNVEFFARAAGVARVTRRDVDDALRQSGVPDRCFSEPAESLPRSHWLGMWFAVAALRKPSAILLDEPASYVDAQTLVDFEDNLGTCLRAGTAILLATADERLAARVASRQAVLRRGRIVLD